MRKLFPQPVIAVMNIRIQNALKDMLPVISNNDLALNVLRANTRAFSVSDLTKDRASTL
ncbi:MAG: hypothetical protein WAM14_06910 [Candidatus Nitrosopolaris sp.]